MNTRRMLIALVTLVALLATTSLAWADTVTKDVYGEIVQQTLPDASTSWAVQDIGAGISAGIIKGYPDKTYKPEREMTVAEFVTMMVRFLGLESAVNPDASLPGTVTSPGWAKGYLDQGIKAGIVDSSTATDGNEGLTREEMAVILAKTLGLAPVSGAFPFNDASDISSAARGYILALVNAGIIKGYPNGTFGPDRVLTRAEAAVLIHRILEKYGQ